MERLILPKQSTVANILGELKPKSVTDIGCNKGGYSILAAQAGARVIAFDIDEVSIGGLYQIAKKQDLCILPLVMDALNPSPALGWRNLQFPSAAHRFCSEMAMALALIHHLAITQRQTFDRIVPALADFSTKWLLIEFVPLDDLLSLNLLKTHPKDMSWYTLSNFLVSLGREFRQVEQFPSFPVGRTLILCTR